MAIGWARFLKWRYDEALTLFRQAIEEVPGNATIIGFSLIGPHWVVRFEC